MENFPSNSREPRVREEQDEQKRVEKAITGSVVRRKKSLSERFRDMFINEGSRGTVEYVVAEVLIPAAKDMFADAVSQGIERMIFGESRSSSRRTSSYRTGGAFGSSHVNYNRYSSSRRDEPYRMPMSRRARASHDFQDIVIPKRVEAERVLDDMYECLSRYGQVTVKDFYELVGENSHYTDEKWGWTDLRGSGISRTNEGYRLNLPRTEPLDD